jgi:hypothetical protein
VQSRLKQRLLDNPSGIFEIKQQFQNMLWSCYFYLVNLTAPDNISASNALRKVIAKRLTEPANSLENMQQILILTNLSNNAALNGANPTHSVIVAFKNNSPPLTFHYQKLAEFHESILLLKIAKTSQLHDLLFELEKAFGFTNFEAQLSSVEDFLNNSSTTDILMKPRTDKVLSTKTDGAKLILNLKTKLKLMREAYLDLYVPENEASAKKLCLNKINVESKSLAEFLENRECATPLFNDAKQEALNKIRNVISAAQSAEVSDDTINTIDAIRKNAKNRLNLTTHTWGLFVYAQGTPRSDAYLDFLDKQFKLLAERKRLLNPENNLHSALTLRGQ